MFWIDNDLVWERVEAGAFKETKKCIVKQGSFRAHYGESVANLFISMKEMGYVINSLIIFKELVSILVPFNYNFFKFWHCFVPVT